MFSHDPLEMIIFMIDLVMGTHHEYEGNERETMALLSLDCIYYNNNAGYETNKEHSSVDR